MEAIVIFIIACIILMLLSKTTESFDGSKDCSNKAINDGIYGYISKNRLQLLKD